ncbi:unnamed protein product [Amoebophrya sp. A120]|nr:unnamed protein product [Amoebophrya sp. A120]|eukprot:GSA120T00005496001.1
MMHLVCKAMRMRTDDDFEPRDLFLPVSFATLDIDWGPDPPPIRVPLRKLHFVGGRVGIELIDGIQVGCLLHQLVTGEANVLYLLQEFSKLPDPSPGATRNLRRYPISWWGAEVPADFETWILRPSSVEKRFVRRGYPRNKRYRTMERYHTTAVASTRKKNGAEERVKPRLKSFACAFAGVYHRRPSGTSQDMAFHIPYTDAEKEKHNADFACHTDAQCLMCDIWKEVLTPDLLNLELHHFVITDKFLPLSHHIDRTLSSHPDWWNRGLSARFWFHNHNAINLRHMSLNHVPHTCFCDIFSAVTSLKIVAYDYPRCRPAFAGANHLHFSRLQYGLLPRCGHSEYEPASVVDELVMRNGIPFYFEGLPSFREFLMNFPFRQKNIDFRFSEEVILTDNQTEDVVFAFYAGKLLSESLSSDARRRFETSLNREKMFMLVHSCACSPIREYWKLAL